MVFRAGKKFVEKMDLSKGSFLLFLVFALLLLIAYNTVLPCWLLGTCRESFSEAADSLQATRKYFKKEWTEPLVKEYIKKNKVKESDVINVQEKSMIVESALMKEFGLKEDAAKDKTSKALIYQALKSFTFST
jgi:hypothetical protein